jgi:hypothetical protein
MRCDYPADVIRFLQGLPQDSPIWVDVVTVRDVRDLIQDSDHPSIPDASEIPAETIGRAMAAFDRARRFDDHPPVQEIADEVVSILTEGGAS